MFISRHFNLEPMTVNIESRWPGEIIENSDNLSEKSLWQTISEKYIFNLQESIVFEKMRKNENSGFYLINYAKIRVKMTYFIAYVPRQDSRL